MVELSHIDTEGQACMVDVSRKKETARSASAQACVLFPQAIYQALKESNLHSKKGSILGVAQIAAIMAAKKTSDLIPMCHPLPIENCSVSFQENDEKHCIYVTACVKVTHKTGVEMEALTAVSLASLTIYDMCKALSHDIKITDISLINKTGGKSDI